MCFGNSFYYSHNYVWYLMGYRPDYETVCPTNSLTSPNNNWKIRENSFPQDVLTLHFYPASACFPHTVLYLQGTVEKM